MNSRAYISSKAFMPTYIDLSGMGPSFGEGKMTLNGNECLNKSIMHK